MTREEFKKRKEDAIFVNEKEMLFDKLMGL
jgi:hypothetical protein